MIKKILLVACAALTLQGCATYPTPCGTGPGTFGYAPNYCANSYGAYTAGQATPVTRGVIYSARTVKVQGTNVIGTVAGGVLGAVAGSAIGGGTGRILGAAGGGLVGAGLGNLVEGKLTSKWAIEYVVRTTGGNFVSVAQTGDAMPIGQHVLIIYGSQTRVIPDPNY